MTRMIRRKKTTTKKSLALCLEDQESLEEDNDDDEKSSSKEERKDQPLYGNIPGIYTGTQKSAPPPPQKIERSRHIIVKREREKQTNRGTRGFIICFLFLLLTYFIVPATNNKQNKQTNKQQPK